MWYVILCMQPYPNGAGVNVYHPHDRNAARDLALSILNGTHKHGAAPCLHIQLWNDEGNMVRARCCRSEYDVQAWMNDACAYF